MNKELSNFAARLRDWIPAGDSVKSLYSNGRMREAPHAGSHKDFDAFALELFAIQFQCNSDYRKICEAQKRTPYTVEHWTQIPFVPTSAFKELELSCIPPGEGIAVFHSSGTTEQKPSRHFHCTESLAVYEASLWPWFARHVVPEFGIRNVEFGLSIFAPPPAQAPHSSLVHMFEVVRRKLGAPEFTFVGKTVAAKAWSLDFDAALVALNESTLNAQRSTLLLGTAFSFVHLLDFLAEKNLRFALPAGSRLMETGGYKNRSRAMPKPELHALITERLGVPPENIVCEYGMSELSSQAYDSEARTFQFPPWARVQIISPETGLETDDGETGLIRVFDLANVFSVAAVQTEDLGIRRGNGFELIGRAQLAEPRGCSLMSARIA